MEFKNTKILDLKELLDELASHPAQSLDRINMYHIAIIHATDKMPKGDMKQLFSLLSSLFGNLIAQRDMRNKAYNTLAKDLYSAIDLLKRIKTYFPDDKHAFCYEEDVNSFIDYVRSEYEL